MILDCLDGIHEWVHVLAKMSRNAAFSMLFNVSAVFGDSARFEHLWPELYILAQFFFYSPTDKRDKTWDNCINWTHAIALSRHETERWSGCMLGVLGRCHYEGDCVGLGTVLMPKIILNGPELGANPKWAHDL